MHNVKPLRKLLRFAAIYGPSRAAFKALGRSRSARFPWRPRRRGVDVAMIGCGQYAFSTIGYFLWKNGRSRFSRCYDIDPTAASTFGSFYGATSAQSVSDILDDPGIGIVYIASNHASHTPYAIAALEAGKAVYAEKPVAVSTEQLAALDAAVCMAPGRISFGFNRPLSPAVAYLRDRWPEHPGPVTISCFITGHVLPPTHWYRHPNEGTRISGNVTHWLDLAVHMLSWRRLADSWTVNAIWARNDERDDNLAITMTSTEGDLVNIVLTSRSEPFEGINETINVQANDLIAKIDDFRSTQLWTGDRYERRRDLWKDVGHENAVLQPFTGSRRDWPEIRASAMLMLEIADMVRLGDKTRAFSFSAAASRLAQTTVGVRHR